MDEIRAGLNNIGPIGPVLKGPRDGVIYSRLFKYTQQYTAGLTFMEYLCDNGYVPLAVNTSCSLPHAWFIIGFVARLTGRVSLAAKVLLAIVLSVLRFADSDYPFGIFKLFWQRTARDLLWPVLYEMFAYRWGFAQLFYQNTGIYGFIRHKLYINLLPKTTRKNSLESHTHSNNQFIIHCNY